MKKLFGIVAAGMFAMSVNACGVADVVNDISDAVKNAAEQAKVEKAFDSAVTQVTGQVISVALLAASEAMTAETAPYSAQADLGTIEIDQTVNTDDGATVTVKGSISGSASDTEANLTLTIDSTWTGLKAVLDDGTTVTTSGSQSISGTIVSSESAFSVNITAKGTMKIDGKDYAFDIALTSDGKTVNYTGTVNGYPVVKTITLPEDEEEEEEEVYAQCKRDDGDVCVSYSTTQFACEDLTDGTYTAVNNCETETTWAFSCTISGHSVQYFNFDDSSNCTMKGGVWAEL